MKPLHYIKKYNLKQTNKFSHKDFVSDLTLDFLSLLEAHCGDRSFKNFENVVGYIRQKWDGIDNKTAGRLPDSLWNYFYATVVAKTKEEIFAEQLQPIREEREEKRKEREKRENFFEDFLESERQRRREFFENLFNESFLASIIISNSVPREELKILGLTEDCTKEDIKKSYRQISMKHHPDKGGNAAKFLEATEAKNKCLAWASK